MVFVRERYKLQVFTFYLYNLRFSFFQKCTCQGAGMNSGGGQASHDMQRLKNIEEELEELRAVYEDQCSQLDEYRKKVSIYENNGNFFLPT